MHSSEEERRIIVKDSEVQVNLFLGEKPYAFGHIVVQPVSDAHDISELSGENWRTVTEWVPKVAKAMRRVLTQVSGREVQRVYLCSFNESKDYTVHFHLIPRYKSEKLMGEDLLAHGVKAQQLISHEEIDVIVRSMKRDLGITTCGAT